MLDLCKFLLRCLCKIEIHLSFEWLEMFMKRKSSPFITDPTNLIYYINIWILKLYVTFKVSGICL